MSGPIFRPASDPACTTCGNTRGACPGYGPVVKSTNRGVACHANAKEGPRCFACDRSIKREPIIAETRDGQTVWAGPECFKKIKAAGEEGYQPPKGGPRLFLLAIGKKS